MKNRTTRAGLCISPRLSFCAVLAIASTSMAQNLQRYYPQQPNGYAQPQYNQPSPNYQQPPPGYGAPAYGYPQQQQKQYENPIEFLPKFGKRMSEVVRRIFYGQNPTGWDNPPPAYGPNGGYSLESTPRQQAAPNYPQPGSGYQQPQQPGYQYPQPQGQSQPRYSYPPQQPTTPATRSQQPAPQLKTPPPSSRTYSPPKVSQTPPKTTSKPATKPQTLPPAPKPQEPAPPPVTTRRSESTPREQSPGTTASSGSSSSFLKGRKTAKPGRVISPYPPYKELDITGLESGSLALDPTTQKVFEVP
jgi:hypothetical protein